MIKTELPSLTLLESPIQYSHRLSPIFFPHSIKEWNSAGFYRNSPASEPLLQDTVSLLGENRFVHLLQQGAMELCESLIQQDRVYRRIFDELKPFQTGIYKGPIDVVQKRVKQSIERNMLMPYEYCDDDLFQALRDVEPAQNDETINIQRALTLLGAVRLDHAHVAPLKREQIYASEGIIYARTDIDRSRTWDRLIKSLQLKYGFPNHIQVLPTAEGMMACKLPIDYVMKKRDGKTSPIVVLSTGVYKETKEYVRSAYAQQTRDCHSGKEIQSMHEWSDTSRNHDFLLYVDPLPNNSRMIPPEVEGICFAAQQLAGDIYDDTVGEIFLVIDVTSIAGAPHLFEKLKNIPNNKKLTIIFAESLLKYTEGGQDKVGLGAFSAFGYKSTDVFRATAQEQNMIPSFETLVLFPDIDNEYIQFRAKKIERNTRLVAELCKQLTHGHNQDGFQIVHPGLHERFQRRLQFIDFQGGYFFIQFPTGTTDHARQFLEVYEKTNTQFGFIETGASFGTNTSRLNYRKPNVIRFAGGVFDVSDTFFQGVHLAKMLDAYLN